jgi:steroid delta-isomerase-like uncharacterized protein
MHIAYYVTWLKAFRESADVICQMYNGEDFIFEDPMLDQHNVHTQADLHRTFVPYANKDPQNGIGIHNFRVRSYIGDRTSGLLRWEWSPEHAASFLGLNVAGKPFTTHGHTFHQFTPDGKIKRESSWWDASEVLRATYDVQPTKSVTNTKGAVPSEVGRTPIAGTGLAGAQQWATALGSDFAALAGLYSSEYFTVDTHKIDDHEEDTANDVAGLAAELGGLSSGENGTYTFTVSEVFEGNGHRLIHWDVTITGADTFRGIPVEGRTLTGVGSTFHEFDENGYIRLESTFWEDNRIFVQLGLPIIRPHYWEADFDMEAFAASLGA